MKHNFGSKLFSIFLSILTIFMLGVIVLRFNLCSILIDGSSMDHTLYSGETVIVLKTKKVQRGDIVIIEVPDRLEGKFRGAYLVKRVVATEGDAFYTVNGEFYRKEKGTDRFHLVEEPYVSSSNPEIPLTTLKEGEVYCLGDNRAISHDSSEVGAFYQTELFGKVIPSFMEESLLKSILIFLL